MFSAKHFTPLEARLNERIHSFGQADRDQRSRLPAGGQGF